MSRPMPRRRSDHLVRRLLGGTLALATALAVAPLVSLATAPPATAADAPAVSDRAPAVSGRAPAVSGRAPAVSGRAPAAGGGLAGSGTAADPYQIGSAADLDTAAAMINADTDCSGDAAATYQLTADIDYAGATFADFTGTFCGTFDGNGHTIANLVNTATLTGTTYASALFYTLSGATVKNLTLDGLSTVPPSQATADSYPVAGLAGSVTSSTITGIGLVDSTISVTTGNTGVALAGLVNTTAGTADSPTTLTDNYLSGTTVTGLKYVGALVATVGSYTTVTDNFVSAQVSNTASGASETATLLARAITGTDGVVLQDNVVYAGSITRDFGSSSYLGGWVSGTPAGTGRTITDNLVNANNSLDIAADPNLVLTASPIAVPGDWPYGSSFALTWSGNHPYDYTGCTGTADPVTGSQCWTIGDDGTYTDQATLATQSTYDAGGLGWDFTTTWAWNGTAQHPVLVHAPVVTTTTRAITVNQNSTLDAATLEDTVGAGIDNGTLSADLSGVDTATTGAQTAYLIGTYDGYTTTVPITVTVQSPGPILTVPTTTITVPEGALPTAAQILAATGATGDEGTPGVDFGTLTAADFATPGTTQTVHITDTVNGASATPVAVTIQITLRGSGTAADPYQIGSVADLDYAAATINADTAHDGAATADYALTADIDYGGNTFAGFTWFGGTFDGAGHTLTNLVNPTSSATKPVTTMFTTDTGTIENLVLSDLTSTVTCTGGATTYDAGLVDTLSGTVRGVELVDSTVVMTPGACATNSFVGGLVRLTSGAAIVTDNEVENTTVGGNKYAGGVVAEAETGASVTDNLVDATIYQATSGAGAAVGGIVEQGAGPITITGNVLYGGSVTAGTGTTPASGGTHTVGAIAGTGTFDDSTDLVGSAAAINPASNGNATTPLNGTATSAADLADQSTYEGVGWDFTDGTIPWAWDATTNAPAVRTAPLLQLTGTTAFGYAAGAESATDARAAILTAAAPTIDQGSASPSYDVDLSGVDLDTPGSYTADVTATDNGAAVTPRPVRIDILDPATLTVSVLNPTLDLNAGASVTAGQLLTRVGATTSQGTAAVNGDDLAAANGAAAAGTTGTYPVRLTSTVRGVTGPATTVTVNVVAAGAPVIEVTSTQQSHIAGDALTDNNGAAILAAAGATATDGSTPTVVFPDGFDENSTGTYTVTLTDGAATPVTIEVTLTAVPTPVITVTHPSASYTEGANPDPATVLADLGASITDADAGATVSIDVSGVDFTTAGAYAAQVTGSFRGVDAAPVPVTIDVLLPGSGTAADPYQIGSAGDLDAAAALVNDDTAHTGAATADYTLTADIDYGGATFADFSWFGGTFDGAGHTISDITYATTTDTKPITAMFDTVTGTVENLALSHVTSEATCVGGATYYVAGVVDTLSGTLRDVALADSTVTMIRGACATNSFTGGLARTASGTITDNMVWNTTVTGNKYAGGLVSNGTATITDNIVDATIEQTTSGAGAGVGGVQASGTPTAATGNVIYAGAVSGTGTHTTSAIGQETTPGTPLGTDNLVSTNLQIVPGTNAATPDNGTPTTPAALASQAAYTGIGWDLGGTGAWTWVDAGAASHPILSFLPVDFSAPVVALVRPSITVSAQSPEPTQDDLIAEFGAAADHGTLSIDLGDDTGDSGAGVNFQLPGSYPVSVIGTDSGISTTVSATIVVTALAGSGTAADPLQIGSRADLDNAVDNLDNGNAVIQSAYQTAHYVLTADINYAGDAFPGIDYFAGVFDGQGHTISNLTYTPSTSTVPDATTLAFFRDLDGATVENLSLNNVVADGTDDVGGLAGTAYASSIHDDSVLAATLTSSGGNVGGLVGGTAYANTRADAGTDASDGSTTTISNNEVLATTQSGPWVVGGVAAVAKGAVTLSNNLVDATLTDTAVAGPGHGTSAGGILGAVGTNNTGANNTGTAATVAVSGNVLLGGSLSYTFGGPRTGYAGSVIGDVSGDPANPAAYGDWSEADDMVSPDAVLGDNLTAGPADTPGQGSQDGTASTATDLATQATYQTLGWDFTSPVWAWDTGDTRPTLAAVPEITVPTVAVNRSTVAYQVGHVPDVTQILADLGATVTPSGTAALDLGGADLTQAGTYTATVSGLLNDAGSRALAITINVVPVITISTAVTQVEYVAGTQVTAAQVLADLGAATSVPGTVSADISQVDFTTPGSYPVTLTATDDFGFTAPAVTAMVQVSDEPAPPTPTPSVDPGVVTITGTPRVGTTLTAHPGTWAPAAAPSYQWLRDGAPIAGATATTYTPVPADAGHLLQVAVTETPDGYRPTTADAEAVTVAAGVFDASAPHIRGTARVGQRLQMDAGSWRPTPAAVAYQWLRNGVPITAATGRSYLLTTADSGHRISVQVDGVRDGYATKVLVSTTVRVSPGTLNAATPRIGGTATVGNRVHATAGTWTPHPRLTYQWTLNGRPVRGATAASWRLPASARGKRLAVQVTGTLTGYRTTTVTSKQVTVRPGTLHHPQPRISGVAAVGRTLRVIAGTWTPHARLTYQWRLGGTPIRGATRASYTLPPSTRGRRVAVKVVGTLAGYQQATGISTVRKVGK